MLMLSPASHGASISDLPGPDRWKDIPDNLSEVPQALAIPFASQALAQAAYQKALNEGLVRRVTIQTSRETLNMSHLNQLTPLARPDHPVASEDIPRRWYSIVVGRNPGVYCGFENIGSNTTGISGNVMAKFATHDAARSNFLAALASGRVVRATKDVTVQIL